MRIDRNIFARLLATALLAFLFFPVRAGASTGCVYPADLDGWADKVAGDYLTIPDVNQFRCAIEKIQAALGIDPAGDYDTVVERLDDLAIAVGKSGGQTIAGGTTANSLTLKPFASSSTQLVLGAGSLAYSAGAIATATPSSSAVNLSATFTGSATGISGVTSSTSITPSATIDTALGGVFHAIANPGSGVTIGTTAAIYTQTDTGSSGGALSTIAGVMVGTPQFGSTKPASAIGVIIGNQGGAGVDEAIGLWVAPQSGANSNIAARFDGLVDLRETSEASPVLIVPNTNHVPLISWETIGGGSNWTPVEQPTGYIKILFGGQDRYIPFWR